MLEIPVIRWGKPYESLQQDPVVHFETGNTLCTVHQANGGLIQMDVRKSQRARDVVPVDTRQADVDRLVDETVARFGRLDLLVNAVGRSARGAALSTTRPARRTTKWRGCWAWATRAARCWTTWPEPAIGTPSCSRAA